MDKTIIDTLPGLSLIVNLIFLQVLFLFVVSIFFLISTSIYSVMVTFLYRLVKLLVNSIYAAYLYCPLVNWKTGFMNIQGYRRHQVKGLNLYRKSFETKSILCRNNHFYGNLIYRISKSRFLKSFLPKRFLLFLKYDNLKRMDYTFGLRHDNRFEKNQALIKKVFDYLDLLIHPIKEFPDKTGSFIDSLDDILNLVFDFATRDTIPAVENGLDHFYAQFFLKIFDKMEELKTLYEDAGFNVEIERKYHKVKLLDRKDNIR